MELILEDVKGELDAIYEEWRNHFSEEDEGKYGVDVKKARELQEASNKGESKQLLIDLQNKDQYDRLMEIMDSVIRLPMNRSGMMATEALNMGIKAFRKTCTNKTLPSPKPLALAVRT